jgi:hypothetical protein
LPRGAPCISSAWQAREWWSWILSWWAWTGSSQPDATAGDRVLRGIKLHFLQAAPSV